MKPFLILTWDKYNRGYRMEEFDTSEEAAAEMARRSSLEGVIAARRLALSITLLDFVPEPAVPEVQPEPAGMTFVQAGNVDDGGIEF